MFKHNRYKAINILNYEIEKEKYSREKRNTISRKTIALITYKLPNLVGWKSMQRKGEKIKI